MKNSDTGSGLFLVVLSIAGIVYTATHGFKSTIGLSPGFFPTFVFAVIGICGLALVIKSLRLKERSWPKFKWGKLGAIIGMLLVYIVLMELIGFIISTALFLVASMLFYGERRLKVLIPVTVCVTAVVFLLWTFVFNIPLPTIIL